MLKIIFFYSKSEVDNLYLYLPFVHSGNGLDKFHLICFISEAVACGISLTGGKY